MKLTVDAKSLDIKFLSMTEGTTQPKLNEGAPKLDDRGRAIYSAAGVSAIRYRDGVPAGQESNVFVSVAKPVDLHFSTIYEPAGDVTVTHFIGGNGRLAVSLLCDDLVPVNGGGAPRLNLNKGGE